jgi:alpha-tubulin suppressor-like RCC1 family protein
MSCWGDDEQGQLGTSPSGARVCTVTPIPGIGPTLAMGTGAGFACALSTSHVVSCWGLNDLGQLGVPPASSPVQLPAPEGPPVVVPGLDNPVGLSVGVSTSCAEFSDGSWQCWGANLQGQASPTPFALPVSGILKVSLGVQTCVLLAGGSIQCWNVDGTYPPTTSVPPAIDVSAGEYQSCAVVADGTVWCWGSNEAGELGVSDTSATGPIAVPGVAGAIQVAAGYLYTCALLETGSVMCWGASKEGALGASTFPSSQPCVAQPGEGYIDVCSTPVVVPGITNAKSIAVRLGEACAILADGTLECWGGGGECP